MKSCILRWAGGRVGSLPPRPPGRAPPAFFPRVGGIPVARPPARVGSSSSLTPSQKLWIGLSWGLKNTVAFKQGPSLCSQDPSPPPSWKNSPSHSLSPSANHFIFSITLSSSFHPDLCLPHPITAYPHSHRYLTAARAPPVLRPGPAPIAAPTQVGVV